MQTRTEQLTSIANSHQYRVLALISMFYMCIMLCNAILTNRYIGTDTLFVLGGTFTSPLIFIFDDIITEIYGYKIARSVILTGFIAQSFFVIVCQLVLMTPSPSFFNAQDAYNYVLGSSLVRINISGFIAYIVANLTNSYVLSRWKILLKGRYFWLRSLGSSTFSEALYSFIAIIMMEISSIPLNNILKVASISFGIKACYSAFLALPVSYLVNFLKKLTGMDVYDLPQKFTPFEYARIN